MPNEFMVAARRELLDAIPEAIHRALASYTDFANNHDDDAASGGDAKSYAAHHAGLKSAISHLEALLKLGRFIAHEDQSQSDRLADTSDNDTLSSLIEKAQATLVLLDHDSPAATEPVISGGAADDQG
ncbi:MAG: hypothetical protein KI792_09880 [Alphaproteobacteria bacterium]|nr:hypothetical protein [Alphaproteobacteria bacterium SS10]